MKIALDVDGVISEAPRFFAALSRALRAAGHEVHIVSDFDEHFRDHRVRELAEYGVAYDALEITSDKAEYCKRHGIDFMLDDDPGEYFPASAVTTIGVVTV